MLTASDAYADRLPAGYNSTWGTGATAPDSSKQLVLADGAHRRYGYAVPHALPRAARLAYERYVCARMRRTGTIVPCGPAVSTGVGGSLLYDEFIVYKVEQVRPKYLLRCAFLYT